MITAPWLTSLAKSGEARFTALQGKKEAGSRPPLCELSLLS